MVAYLIATQKRWRKNEEWTIDVMGSQSIQQKPIINQIIASIQRLNQSTIPWSWRIADEIFQCMDKDPTHEGQTDTKNEEQLRSTYNWELVDEITSVVKCFKGFEWAIQFRVFAHTSSLHNSKKKLNNQRCNKRRPDPIKYVLHTYVTPIWN